MATSIGNRAAPIGERVFYTGMALFAFACLVWGFAPSFFLRGVVEPRSPLRPMNLPALAHGVAATAWFLLFIAQSGLVSARRPDLHRRLGAIGLPVGLLAAALGVWASVNVARFEVGNIRVAASLLVSVFEFALFGALVAYALAHRHAPQSHKRLLLVATLTLVSAGLGRFGLDAPFRGLRGGYLLTFLTFLPLFAWDLATLRRLHRATVVGVGAAVAVWLFNLAIRHTPEWQALTVRLVG